MCHKPVTEPVPSTFRNLHVYHFLSKTLLLRTCCEYLYCGCPGISLLVSHEKLLMALKELLPKQFWRRWPENLWTIMSCELSKLSCEPSEKAFRVLTTVSWKENHWERVGRRAQKICISPLLPVLESVQVLFISLASTPSPTGTKKRTALGFELCITVLTVCG